MRTDLELEEAVALLTEGLAPLGCETVPLPEAAGRVLAGDVKAVRDQPPFDRSPVDGYALRSADLGGADCRHPVRLRVVDTVYAGQAAGAAVQAGEAVQVATGAMLPAGCDAVVRQEDAVREDGAVAVGRPLWPFDNYIHRGEDYRAGDVLLPAGTKLNAAAVGLLAGLGLDGVSVRRRPQTAVFATGDELAAPGDPLPPGCIYDANRPMLCARLVGLGMGAGPGVVCRDDPASLAALMREAAETCDLIVTTGGASVGERDILHAALPLLGAEPVFSGVRVKPGGHILFSRCAGTPILSLSGNPFAAAATFELLALPMLAALMDDPSLPPRRAQAVLETPFPKASPGRRFLRGRLSRGRVALPAEQSSGVLSSLAGCNCLVDLPAGTGPLDMGAPVRVLVFHP